MASSKGLPGSKYSSTDGSTEYIEFSDLEKEKNGGIHVVERVDSKSSQEEVHTRPIETAEDLVTEVIRAEDDPTLNPGC